MKETGGCGFRGFRMAARSLRLRKRQVVGGGEGQDDRSKRSAEPSTIETYSLLV